MKLLRTIKRLLWRRRFWAVLFFLVLLFNIALIGGTLSSTRNELISNPAVRALLPIYRSFREIADTLLDSLYLFAMRRDVGIPVYRLDVKRSDLKKLEDAIPSSLSEAVLGETFRFETLKDTVKGAFYADDTAYEVDVRFRGENANHWVWPKKSWQIKFDKDTPFKGTKTLKLILPDDRGYFAEVLNNYRAKKLGLIVPQAEFAELYVNGAYHGVYFAVEDFSKEFLERNQKPSDANLYAMFTDEAATREGEALGAFSSADYWRKESEDTVFPYDNLGELDFLLDLMRKDDFAASAADIIDLPSFYAWNTVAILAGSNHQSSQGNMRLYFNNAKGKFEFLPWDVGVKEYLPTELTNKLSEKILENPDFYLARNRKLYEYVESEQHLEDDIAYYDSLYRKLKGAFYSDFKKHDNNREFNRTVTEIRSRYQMLFRRIRKLFEEDRATVALHHDGSHNLVILDIVPESFSGLRVESVKLPDGARVTVLPQTLLRSERERIEVRYEGTIRDISKAEITLKNQVTGKTLAAPPVRFSDISTFASFGDIALSKEAFVKAHPMFFQSGGSIILPSGTHFFPKDVIVPKGYRLRIDAGASLYFAPGVSLVSYSPVEARGTSGSPIIIRPQYPGRPWGSFAVLNTGSEKSTLSYIDADGGESDYVNGVFLSGMLSLYYSNIAIDHAVISGSASDDGVNVKYSPLELRNSVFRNNSADGLDLDYVTGEVRDNVFVDNGNDGIDTSGSELRIVRNRITGSGDKCVSIGERTQNTILFNNILRRCSVGIEVKDGSSPVILNTIIAENGMGIHEYRKKALYETGGNATVVNSLIRDNKKAIEFDEFSDMSISHSNIEGGYEGKGNFDNEGDYSVIRDIGKGSAAALKDYLGREVTLAPVGLLEQF